jgi:hypothetical protein
MKDGDYRTLWRERRIDEQREFKREIDRERERKRNKMNNGGDRD